MEAVGPSLDYLDPDKGDMHRPFIDLLFSSPLRQYILSTNKFSTQYLLDRPLAIFNE